ncbi:MAG: hypothetical protein NTY38_33585, partial [Acidobacteria bacterium]|nr:hypothetical protein [Acidobacteriota bacterium]
MHRLICAGLFAAALTAAPAPTFNGGIQDPAAFRKSIEARLTLARQALEKAVSPSPSRTANEIMELAQEFDFEISIVSGECGLFGQTHPDANLRKLARELTTRAEELETAAQTDPRLYAAYSKMDLAAADPATRFLIEKRLRKLRLEGAGRDAATRDRVRSLHTLLTAARLEFDTNIAAGRRTLVLSSAAELDGLPEDYRKAHPAGPDGKISISSDTPDSQPVLLYARNADVRRR